ncbi:MAG: response regulator transcription factor [Lachnospiraceae bacterium]|nr:response regulator transcription factor [Lachnospiraceae bacterium]
MKIVICESNIVEQEEIRKFLIRILFEEDIDIRCFETGEDLLKAAEEQDFYADIVFMGIKLPGMDGIQTARLLRRKKEQTAVVFLTAYSEYVFQGYEVHAYDYLLKPASEGKLKKVILRFLEEKESEEKKYLVVNKRSGRKKIVLENVVYFSSDKRKMMAVMEEPYGTVEFYMTMRELDGYLAGEPFLRCHQSFLINMQKITGWDSTRIITEGGNAIPISKKYRNQVGNILNSGIDVRRELKKI